MATVVHDAEIIEKTFVSAKRSNGFYGLYDWGGAYLGAALPNQSGVYRFINNGQLMHLEMSYLYDIADILGYLNDKNKKERV